MNNCNVLLWEPTDRKQILPKIRHIQDVLEFERLVHSIDSGMHYNITNASHIQEMIVSDEDTPTFVMNKMKICKPLAFVGHVLSSTGINNPRKISITRRIRCTRGRTICLTRDILRGIRVWRYGTRSDISMTTLPFINDFSWRKQTIRTMALVSFRGFNRRWWITFLWILFAKMTAHATFVATGSTLLPC